jgi:hypothetical protein
MTDGPKPDEQKIIIDEDWKSRVEEEREELRQKDVPAGDSGAGPGDSGAGPGDSAASAAAGEQAVPLPPATLSVLISSLYLQGMIALGLLPNPVTQKAETNLDQARHTVDMLAMLQQKTQGNRTPEESDDLDHVLHELRMAFVALKQNPPAAE